MYSLGRNTRKEIIGQSNYICKTMRELKKKKALFIWEAVSTLTSLQHRTYYREKWNKDLWIW